MDSILSDEIKFKIPFGAIISGSSNTGKTELLIRLLRNADDMFTPFVKDILYCYGQYGSHIVELQSMGVKVHSGVPPDWLLERLDKPFLLILDDLIDVVDQKTLTSYYTRRSHHENFGVIVVTQNLFSKNLQIARNNSSYVIISRSPNALLQIRNFGMQIFPGKTQLQYFLDAYKDATSIQYGHYLLLLFLCLSLGYLLVDLHPTTDSSLRLRTKIFPEDEFPIVYQPKSS
jgi:hypothetical protein